MLKTVLLKLLSGAAHFVPFRYTMRLNGQQFFAPFYHAVSEDHLPHVQNLYPARTPGQFKADLDFLLKYFEPVSLEELWQIVQENRLDEKPRMFLSFDDGLRECEEIIAPILHQKGIPATFFINPDFVDNKALMFRYKASLLIEENQKRQFTSAEKDAIVTATTGIAGKTFGEQMLNIHYNQQTALDEIAQILQVDFDDYLTKKRPYMTMTEIGQLVQMGFTVGAHSLDHPEYRFIPFEEQLRQTTESLHWVDQHFMTPLATFAFPFTDFGVGRKWFEGILEGAKPKAHLTFGAAGLKQDAIPRHLQRFPMEGTLLPAKDIVTAEFIYYIFKAPFGKNRIKRI